MVSEIQFIDDDLANTSLDEDEYIVEKIISHRRKLNGEFQYFLKWKGYPDEESSWENESNIYSKELIQEYWNKRGGRPNSSRRFFNQESNNQIRHHNNSDDNNIRNDKATNNQNSSGKKRRSYNNAMEMEYINHDSSESLILESNKNYRRRRGNFEEMEFEEDNEKDNDDDDNSGFSDEDYSRNYRKNYHRVKSVQRNNRIIRVRDSINTNIRRTKNHHDSNNNNKKNKISNNNKNKTSNNNKNKTSNNNNKYSAMAQDNDLNIPWGMGGLEEMDSWEEYIESVDYITREDGELLVYVTWKFGFKSVHTSTVANFKCPQKVIKFYEKHIRFVS
ncbi:hypothetical protein Glove_134g224 [Diversispora epigaea]|uniref:Chromo domain-containing protein n=1 Tax=Diversispora epigaea TaxID=1348612 RepID=A0A397J125_9GLOM|nr:hypothetical protein Glove_134g224 [Diversispora epigaea]